MVQGHIRLPTSLPRLMFRAGHLELLFVLPSAAYPYYQLCKAIWAIRLVHEVNGKGIIFAQ